MESPDLPAFIAAFETPRRRALLRSLEFSVVTPTHGKSRQEHALNLAAFRTTVKELFDNLSEWEQHAKEQCSFLAGNITLEFQTLGPDEWRKPGNFPIPASALSKTSATRRYLDLDGIELPAVERLVGLNIYSSPGLVMHPAALCQLATAAPHVESLRLIFIDPANKRKELRKSLRTALASGLQQLQLPRLRELHLGREVTSSCNNHSYDFGDLEVDGVDLLSQAIRTLAQRSPITDLSLSGCVTSEDLFLDKASPAGTTSTWPTLRSFSVLEFFVLPSGAWLFSGNPTGTAIQPLNLSRASAAAEPPELELDYSGSIEDVTDSDDDNERDLVANGTSPLHEWRTSPDPHTFNPLMSAMADAVLRMPQLRQGRMTFTSDRADHHITVACTEAGERSEVPRENGPAQEEPMRRWEVGLGGDAAWTPPDGVVATWRKWTGTDGYVTSFQSPYVRDVE